MQRGRKPTPTAIKQVRGLPLRGSADAGQSLRPVGPPFTSMSDEAKEVWRQLSDEWSHVLSRQDRGALRLYCDAWVEMENAQTRVEEDGAMILTPNGMVQKSPWLTKVEQSREFLRKMAAEFGATPSARSRVARSDDDKSDPADEFLN